MRLDQEVLDTPKFDSKVEEMQEKITKALASDGISQHSTCPTGGGYGWDVLAHHALVKLQRNRTDWHFEKAYKFECYDWTITLK